MIIAIEGRDGVGKSTQAKLLVQKWIDAGGGAAYVKSPSNAGLGLTYKLIYKMLNNGLARKHPILFQGFFTLNRILWALFVKPFMFRTHLFVMDRWTLSMEIYGYREGVPRFFLKFFSWLCLKPDLTIVLDGKSHLDVRGKNDVYEQDGHLQEIVSSDYLNAVNNVDVFIENGNGTIEEVHENIITRVLRFASKL